MEGKQKSYSKRPLILAIIFGCLALIAGVIFLALWISDLDEDDNNCKPNHGKNKGPDYKSGYGIYNYAGVATESALCSEIANDVLARQRGNAVDAAISALLCTGIMYAQSAGVGGGSFFLIKDKKQGVFAVDCRETAPAAATKDMYVGEANAGKSLLGGLAVGVPGAVKGMYDIHKRFGTAAWKSLVMPSVKLLRDGFELNEAVHLILEETLPTLTDKSGFEVYMKDDGTIKSVGSLIKMPKLADTYETIANDPTSFYEGALARDIVKDIQDRGGIVTEEDLKDYTVRWRNATRLELPGNLTLFSMPPPGSGAVISYILSTLSGYNMNPDSVANDDNTILTYHRIIEAMKFAYGKRSFLGDEDFVDVTELVKNLTSRSFGESTRARIDDTKTEGLDYYDPDFFLSDDHGTNHLTTIDGEGNAVSVTTTINTYFGSKVIGERTGIVFNNEMDDFSTPNLTNAFGVPPSASNFIVPGKRPQSSMSPSIIVDDKTNEVRMLAGAAGGTRITTTTAMLAMDVLWFGMTMPQAMDQPRIHHQLMPMEVVVENELKQAIKAGLEAKGHKVVPRDIMSIAHAIAVTHDAVVPVSDFRKGGQPAGY